VASEDRLLHWCLIRILGIFVCASAPWVNKWGEGFDSGSILYCRMAGSKIRMYNIPFWVYLVNGRVYVVHLQ
jgi:hypothetical protein